MVVSVGMVSMDTKDETTLLEMCDSNKKLSRAAILAVVEKELPHLVTAVEVSLKKREIQGDRKGMAEDIVQNVLVDMVLRTRDGSMLDIKKSIESYLYGAARLSMKRYLRDQARKQDKPPDSDAFWEKTDRLLLDAGISPSEARESEDAVFDCIQRLMGKQQVYMKLLAEDCEDPPSDSEIGRLFNVSAVSVRNVIFEARKHMAECLSKKGVDLSALGKGGTP
ncbi:MAG TPA: sigma-70 family RNA polymerase sigma factor [Planctomycetota bacterium]|nr:sigma-70 family RNA polymerase sigma factor [Planctomycetota bacterium]